MNSRILIALAVLTGLMNPVAAAISAAEHHKNSEPVMLALFVIPWLVGAYLIHRDRRAAGAVVLSVLAVLNLVMAPSWQRGSVADWTSQAVAVAGSIGVLIGAVTVLVQRYRSPRLTGAL